MTAQRRYWQELADLKRDGRYMDLCQERTEKIDRCIDVFTAVTSSSSIAAWAIWQTLSWVWAFIIAASQVLHAVKRYLPYKKRLAALSTLSRDLNTLVLVAETDWFKVSNGSLTEEEIHDLQMKLKKKKQDCVHKAFPSGSLPENKKLLKCADEDAQRYLATYYGEGDG